MHGQELWRTDGTTAGTQLVMDIYTGFNSSSPQGFTVFDGWLYFAAEDAAHGQELWRTDGTAAHTTRLTDINPGANDAILEWFAATADYLFFTADDGSGSGGAGSGADLWRWDGNALSRGDDLNPIGYENPQDLKVMDGAVYFAATDGTSGYELWRADGLTTTMLADIYPGIGASGPDELTAAGHQLFFRALDPTGGFELWVTDGTPGGTQRVADLYPGPVGSLPTGLTAVGDVVVFAAAQPATGYELWQSDGTPGGTTLVADAAPGAENFNPEQMIVVGGSLYFTADTAAVGRELWSLPLSTDLRVGGVGGPNPALTSVPVTYTLTITNVGDTLATGVTLTDTLPASFTAGAGAASQGGCSGSGPVICALGNLSAGASATVTITALPTLVGIYTNTVTIGTYVLDVQPANNSAAITLTVNQGTRYVFLPLAVR